MKGNELNSVTLGIQIDVNSIQRIHFVTIRIEIIAINCFFFKLTLNTLSLCVGV